MPSEWYPIAPDLTDKGYFTALAHLPKAEDYRPHPDTHVPKDQRFRKQAIADRATEISVLSALGVLGRVNITAETSTRGIYRDVWACHEVVPTEPSGPIQGTRWGAGFRLTLTMTNLRAEFEASLQWAAVATQLGLSNTSFELRTFGISETSLLKGFPVAGQFDESALKAIQEAEGQIRAYMDSAREQLIAVPFQVLLDGPPTVSALEEARATYLAMKQIADKRALAPAIEKAREKGISELVVRQVYHALVGAEADVPITDTARTRAQDWLRKTDD